ncbi:hypothetical protein H7171_01240 [Candidatus Saccharibacteria bacterium]|nr:hypothetical protein [Candidatus Saccharibacteria bacterium]
MTAHEQAGASPERIPEIPPNFGSDLLTVLGYGSLIGETFDKYQIDGKPMRAEQFVEVCWIYPKARDRLQYIAETIKNSGPDTKPGDDPDRDDAVAYADELVKMYLKDVIKQVAEKSD